MGIREDEVINKEKKKITKSNFLEKKKQNQKNCTFTVLAIACHTFIYSFKATSGISKLASGLTQGLDPPSAGRSTFPGVFPDTRSTLSITTAFSTKRIHPAVDCRMRPLEIP